jgi:lysophospholipase L1-like esterase
MIKFLIVVFAAFWVSADALTQANAFENEIRAFEYADSLAQPKPGSVLLWGSSSFRFWTNAHTDLAPFPIVNRGFGGSQMSDAIQYFDRAVVPHRPLIILIYAGDNDLASDKSPEQVLADFGQLVTLAQARLPGTKIGFVAIKPSPLRAKLLPQQREANRLIRQFCRQGKNLAFIDIFTPMLDAQGQPRPDLFIADKLHLNLLGYQLWTGIVKKYLQKNYRP